MLKVFKIINLILALVVSLAACGLFVLHIVGIIYAICTDNGELGGILAALITAWAFFGVFIFMGLWVWVSGAFDSLIPYTYTPTTTSKKYGNDDDYSTYGSEWWGCS